MLISSFIMLVPHQQVLAMFSDLTALTMIAQSPQAIVEFTTCTKMAQLTMALADAEVRTESHLTRKCIDMLLLTATVQTFLCTIPTGKELICQALTGMETKIRTG